MAEELPPDQYQAFEQELTELITNMIATGEVDAALVEVEFSALIQKYLGDLPESRLDLSQQLVKIIMATVHKNIHKRQATDDLTLPTPSLEEVLAVMPELAVISLEQYFVLIFFYLLGIDKSHS